MTATLSNHFFKPFLQTTTMVHNLKSMFILVVVVEIKVKYNHKTQL